MRVPALLLLVLLAATAPACKSRKAVPVDTSEAGDIPREVALQKLRELLPTAEYVYCTAPKTSLKGADIRTFTVRNDGIEMDYGKGKALQFSYSEITAVNLELIGKYYTARVFTSVQPEANREHFAYQWRQEDAAKRAVELLSSLKKK